MSGPVVPANSESGRLAMIGRVAVGASALLVGILAVMLSSPSQQAVGQSCAGQFTINFSGLPAGTIIGEQYAASGVHISAVANENHPDALIVFDTNAPPTHDPDLAVDIGNIAVLAENVRDENGDGLVDDPDENNFGGQVTFAFDQEVSIGSVKWIDKDHVQDNFVIAYNAAGEVIVSVPVPLGANASVQTIAINAVGVRRLVFDYQESGGFTGIEVGCEQGAPTPTGSAGTPTPAAGAGTPTPAAGAGTPTPAAGAGTPTPAAAAVAVAGEGAAPRQGSAVLGAAALPAGGGPQSADEGSLAWTAPLIVLAFVLGGSLLWTRRRTVLGAEALPASGGSQSADEGSLARTAPLVVLALVLGGVFFWTQRRRR